MRLDIHHYINLRPEVLSQLDGLHRKLDLLIRRIEAMSQELDALTAQVASNTAVIESARVLINGIADRITAAGVDATKLAALSAELKASDESLAAAVAANTSAPTT